MSSCKVASISNSLVFSPSSSASTKSSPKTPSSSSSPRVFRLQKPSGLAISLSSSSSTNAPADSSLKRKVRPPRLVIPATFVEEKAVAAAAAEEEVVVVEGDGYAVCCKKGKRRDLIEDRFSAAVGIHGDSNKAIFGLYDGHGGPKAAEFASQNLGKNIIRELGKRDSSKEDIELAIESGYLTTDSEFLETDLRGGTCCVTALLSKGDLVVSNAGDCRAVSCRDGIAEALTSDHCPSREDEKERIENLGGFVECRNGVGRVLGSLAVSRSIGDQYLKQWVTAEPETKVLRLEQEHEFLLLASDGLWDKVGNQEAVDVARHLCVGVDKPQPLLACRKLVDLSVSRGSTDDISVMFIQLQSFC